MFGISFAIMSATIFSVQNTAEHSAVVYATPLQGMILTTLASKSSVQELKLPRSKNQLNFSTLFEFFHILMLKIL